MLEAVAQSAPGAPCANGCLHPKRRAAAAGDPPRCGKRLPEPALARTCRRKGRRHEYCRCTVEYAPGDGRRQNVHTKQWKTATERDKIEQRKLVGVGKDVPLDNDRYLIREDKLSGFLLKPGAKHSAEFFGAGYSVGDSQLLNSDIYAQYDEARKTDVHILDDGTERFSIFMTLGKGRRKRFRTVWQKETGDDKPQFVTAYRENAHDSDV